MCPVYHIPRCTIHTEKQDGLPYSYQQDPHYSPNDEQKRNVVSSPCGSCPCSVKKKNPRFRTQYPQNTTMLISISNHVVSPTPNLPLPSPPLPLSHTPPTSPSPSATRTPHPSIPHTLQSPIPHPSPHPTAIHPRIPTPWTRRPHSRTSRTARSQGGRHWRV